MNERYQLLEGFEFCRCGVRTRDDFAFVTQKLLNDNPLEPLAGCYFYLPNEPPEERWSFRYFSTSLGAYACAPDLSRERWCFATKGGRVYVVGKEDDDWENNITDDQRISVNNVKSVRNGHAIAVCSGRKVFLREEANKWIILDNGLNPKDDDTIPEKMGFLDIDGFSESDMYACGGHSDLWHYDGTLWNKIDLPTNSVLHNICCASDGHVYITTNSRYVWMGREDRWELIKQDLTEEVLEGIVEYREQVIVSTVSELYCVDNGVFNVWNGGIPTMKSKAFLASNDGVLLVAGKDEAVFHDGQSWQVIIEPA